MIQMEKKKTKKEIVKMLLHAEIGEQDEEELIDLLINQPISVDVDKQEEAKMTKGDFVADKISAIAGSWTFIIIFICFLIFWIILNSVILNKNSRVDPYPFILLNLLLSCLAALQAPIIMMSQNRQAEKDSLRNQNDYRTDLKSELILEELHRQMDKLERNQRTIMNYINEEKSKEEEKK